MDFIGPYTGEHTPTRGQRVCVRKYVELECFLLRRGNVMYCHFDSVSNTSDSVVD